MNNETKLKVSEPISGVERAAILLLTVGEVEAANVMQLLEPKEVQKIGVAMTSLKAVTKFDVTKVVKDFYDIVGTATSLGLDTDEYVKNVLVKALGEDKAGSLIDRILLGGDVKGLDAFKWMDPRSIADVIRNEHPQIISIVLSFLENDQAAEVLMQFQDSVRIDVILRIATLEGIQPSALQELNVIMEKQFSGSVNMKSSAVGGVKTAANILNLLDSSIESEIIDGVKDVDADLADTIQELIFVFDNLIEIDDRGIQSLLKEVSSEDLVMALKGADEGIQDKIFKNMSKRAGEILKDDLESRGPVRLRDVEGAQKGIVAIARRMTETGEIVLSGGGDEFV